MHSATCRMLQAGSLRAPEQTCNELSSLLLQAYRIRFVIRLLEPDLDVILYRRGQILPYVIGSDRQLAVAAVNQDGELNAGRTPEGTDCVHCGPDCPAGEQD